VPDIRKDMRPWQVALAFHVPALLGALCATCLYACQGSNAGGGVYYRDASRVGAWRAPNPTMSGAGGNDQSGSAGTAGMHSGLQTSTGAGGTTGVAFGAAGRQGTGGMGGAGAVPGVGGTTGVIGPAGMTAMGANSGSLSFDVVTVNQGGWFAPRNVGAIWIEDSSGKFVKTLKVWAAIRSRYLTKFGT